MNSTNQDLPLTALCVVSDRSKCPSNYTPIFKSYDSNTDTDLWKDGLFGKKENRYICYTKDYPLADTFNVIEDVKLLNERENIIGGFLPVDKCLDTNDKCFQKKVLCIKVSHRYFTSVAVSDIIILVRTKRAPAGYSYIGDINNHTICVKFSPVPNTNAPTTSPLNQFQPTPVSNSFSLNDYVVVRPSPRPPSITQPSTHTNNQNNADSNGFSNFNQTILDNGTLHRGVQQQHSTSAYNPLQGVPFEINPIYDSAKSGYKMDNIDLEVLNRREQSLNEALNKFNYDFRLERTYLTS